MLFSPPPGTSPRMRGKPFQLRNKVLDQRNIPAYAGKTCSGVWSPGFIKEHPRVCGENWSILQIGAGLEGNIPAYAGKTQRVSSGFSFLSEHPRVCGENPETGVISWMRIGTSPRMRGKRFQKNCTKFYLGNIPAYAGKTLLLRAMGLFSGEHPRVCGENHQAI